MSDPRPLDRGRQGDDPAANADADDTGGRADASDETADAGANVDIDAEDPAALTAQLEVLAEENRRLRREYARARQTQYRRTALALFAVGVVGVAGGVAFPALRAVLVVLGAIGVFAGVLVYFVTPERAVPATVGERVYAAHADLGASLVAELGLSDQRVYVPTDGGARLFVPQRESFELPAADELGGTFVAPAAESRGVALAPTGDGLATEFERGLDGDLGDVVEDDGTAAVARLLAEGLVEQFELLDSAVVEDAGDRRVVVGVAGSAYGPTDRFDHPVPSLLAVGIARAAGDPVEATVGDGDDRSDALVTVRQLDAADE